METIKKKHLSVLVVFVSIIFHINTLEAQELTNLPEPAVKGNSYNTGIGLRAGETSGLTFKQFIGKQHAIEVILGLWHHGVSATALYEHHTKAFDVSGLTWNYGIGAHASYQTGHQYFYQTRNVLIGGYEPHVLGIGLDGMFGMEYKIPNAPIAAGLGVKPYLEYMTNNKVRGSIDPGVSIRVVF